MNSRSAQLLAATLTFLLIVLVGATIFILLSRPPSPGPTASLTIGPTVAPSTGSGSLLPTPTLFPTPTLVPTPTLIPTAGPTDTPLVEPTITPTPSPSPTPTPTLPPPTSPQREVTIVDFGVDHRTDVTAVQRTVSFRVDGPSLISARLSGVSSGNVRMCLLREAQDPERECITAHSGTLSRAVFDAGQTNWNVTVIGASAVAGQFATLTLEFNALSGDMSLDSFRFRGTDDPHNNGFEIVLGAAADGDLRVRAQIDDGNDNAYQWHLHLAVDAAPVFDQSGGPSTAVDLSTALTNGVAYDVALTEPEASAGGTFAVFVGARLTWP